MGVCGLQAPLTGALPPGTDAMIPPVQTPHSLSSPAWALRANYVADLT